MNCYFNLWLFAPTPTKVIPRELELSRVNESRIYDLFCLDSSCRFLAFCNTLTKVDSQEGRKGKESPIYGLFCFDRGKIFASL